MIEEEEKGPTDINPDALEAVFVGEEVIVEEEEIFIAEVSSVDDDEDAVDLAFQEDEGYW